MKTELKIQTRAFPVIIADQQTNERSKDTIVLTKEQLQAAQVVGQSSKELIHRLYSRQGFTVLEIGTPTRREITVNLEELFHPPEEAEPIEL